MKKKRVKEKRELERECKLSFNILDEDASNAFIQVYYNNWDLKQNLKQ